MCYQFKLINSLICSVFFALIFMQIPAQAKSASASVNKSNTHRYIVILDDMPLATYDGRVIATPEKAESKTQFAPTAIGYTGEKKLNVRTPASLQYLHFLDQRFKAFKGEALLRLGRQINPVYRYHHVANGFAVDLTESEARAMLAMPMVTSVEQ